MEDKIQKDKKSRDESWKDLMECTRNLLGLKKR